MSAEPPHDPKTLWRNQPTEEVPLSLEHIHARNFQAAIRWRNLKEYAATVFVVVAFGAYVVFLPNPLLKLGSGMTILAALYVAWQVHRRGSARQAPLGAADSLAFHRQELARQRDAARSAWLWYLAPFVPGLALFFVAMAQTARSWIVAPPVVALLIIVFAVILHLNRRAARAMQQQIDELDALRRE